MCWPRPPWWRAWDQPGEPFHDHNGHRVLMGPATNGVDPPMIYETGPVDWNGMGTTNADDDPVSRNINSLAVQPNGTPTDVLQPWKDWSHLRFYFLDSTNLNQVQNSQDTMNELPQSVLDFYQQAHTGTGVLQFSQPSYSVSETGGVAVITVNRAFKTATNVSVSFATLDGTARSNVNYVTASGVLNFGATDTAQTFSVPILHDHIATGPISLQLVLSNPTGGAMLGGYASASDSPSRMLTRPTASRSRTPTMPAPARCVRRCLSANASTNNCVIAFNITGSSLTISPASRCRHHQRGDD